MEGHVFDSVTRYLEKEEKMETPLQWNVRAKCEPDTDNETRELEGKLRKLERSWKLKKAQLPWESMQGFELPQYEAKMREAKRRFVARRGCPMKGTDMQKYIWLKERRVVSLIDKDNADLMAS